MNNNLATKLGKALLKNHYYLVSAESCTGGWLAEAVTAIAGSSAWFERGFVTYSNDSKQEVLFGLLMLFRNRFMLNVIILKRIEVKFVNRL